MSYYCLFWYLFFLHPFSFPQFLLLSFHHHGHLFAFHCFFYFSIITIIIITIIISNTQFTDPFLLRRLSLLLLQVLLHNHNQSIIIIIIIIIIISNTQFTDPFLLRRNEMREEWSLGHHIMDEERPQLGREEIRACPHPPLKAHLDSGELQLNDGLHPSSSSSWIPRRAGPLMGGGSSTGGVWGWGGGLGGCSHYRRYRSRVWWSPPGGWSWGGQTRRPFVRGCCRQRGLQEHLATLAPLQ